MTFKVIHRWQDLDLELKIGDIINLVPSEVKEARERIKKHGDLCDLVGYTWKYRVPLTYLKEVKDDE